MSDRATALIGLHDKHLIVLSVVIAAIAADAALDLAGRLTVTQGRTRIVLWLVGSTILLSQRYADAMEVGISLCTPLLRRHTSGEISTNKIR